MKFGSHSVMPGQTYMKMRQMMTISSQQPFAKLATTQIE